MSPIQQEIEVNRNATYIFFHTNSVENLVEPVKSAIQETCKEIYRDDFRDEFVFETCLSYRICALNPSNTKELKIYITPDLENRKITRVMITSDHNIQKEYLSRYIISVRQAIKDL